MRAVCDQCGATLSRTCKPAVGALPGSVRYGQGRPLAKLWAWARHCLVLPDGHSRVQHKAFDPSFAIRSHARMDLVLLPAAARWLAAERPINESDENGEPPRLP